jgi:hypothetical protein
VTTRELRDDLRDAISNLRASRDKYRHRPDWATPTTRERATVLRGVIVELWPRRHG